MKGVERGRKVDEKDEKEMWEGQKRDAILSYSREKPKEGAKGRLREAGRRTMGGLRGERTLLRVCIVKVIAEGGR